MAEKKTYVKPVLDYCGPVSERTLGGASGRREDPGYGASGYDWGVGGGGPKK
jgi:hypothetical protein